MKKTWILLVFILEIFACQKDVIKTDSSIDIQKEIFRYADSVLKDVGFQVNKEDELVIIKSKNKVIGWNILGKRDGKKVTILTIGTNNGVTPTGIWINSFSIENSSVGNRISAISSLNGITGKTKRYNRPTENSFVENQDLRIVKKMIFPAKPIITVTTVDDQGLPISSEYIYMGLLGLGSGESTYNNDNNGNYTNLEYIDPFWTPDGPSQLPQMIESAQEWFDKLEDVSLNTQQINNPCVVGIINSIGMIPNSISDAIKTVFDDNVKLNINFVPVTGLGKPATTSVTGGPKYERRSMNGLSFTSLDVTIQLDESYFGVATKPYLFTTILHELYHAYFLYRQAECVGSAEKEQKFADDFSFIRPASITDGSISFGTQRVHHEEMANKYIHEFIAAISAMYPISSDALTPLKQTSYPDLNINNYYESLAWDGLTETRIWIDKKEDAVSRDWARMLLFIASAESNGTIDNISKTRGQ